MKRTLTIVGALMAWVTTAMAGGDTGTEGTSLITILLLGFGTVIVLGQLIPGLILLYSMIKGLLGKTESKTGPVVDHK